jgi:hypothetical protein
MSAQLSRARKFAQAASPVLLNVASGYANKPASYVGEVLFPVIDVDDLAFKVPIFGSDSMRILPTERAGYAKSNIFTPATADFADFMLEEHDLSVPSDYSDDISGKRWYKARQHGIRINTNAMRLKREYLVAGFAQDVSTYPSANVKALSGSSKWTHPDSDPVKDIQDAIEAIDSDDANRLILGAKSFKALQNHPKIKASMSFNQTGIQNDSTVTEEHLSRIFDIPVVRRARSRFIDSAGVKRYVWNDNIAIVAYVNATPRPQADYFESSFGYSFMLEGYPVPDQWQSEDKKVNYDRITAWMKHAVVDNTCGYLITGCV